MRNSPSANTRSRVRHHAAGNVEDKDKTIPVTVAGIFTNTEEQDSIGMAPSYDLYDNIVFTDLSTASFLLYGTEGTTNVQYGISM